MGKPHEISEPMSILVTNQLDTILSSTGLDTFLGLLAQVVEHKGHELNIYGWQDMADELRALREHDFS